MLKTVVMMAGTYVVISLFNIAPNIANKILMTMTWPQLVTGILGIVLANILGTRLEASEKAIKKD